MYTSIYISIYYTHDLADVKHDTMDAEVIVMNLWSWLNESQTGSMVFSWIKVFASVILGLFIADGADVFGVDASDLRLWLAAGFAAVLPLVINWLNPHDTRYGVNYDSSGT